MRTHTRSAGFTLVEVMVSAGIVVVLMGVLVSMTDQTQRLMRSTSAKVEQFQEARVAFEAMTRRLAQATLNPFWDYKYDKNGLPTNYQRSAELRFISGPSGGSRSILTGSGDSKVRPGHSVFFHTPNGHAEDTKTFAALDHLINAGGFFVEIATDEDSIPPFLRGQMDSRKRFRLMELMQPSEQLKTYQFQQPGNRNWFAPFVGASNRPVRTIAENIVMLVILPRLSRADELAWMKQKGSITAPILATEYGYDTTNASVADPVLNPRNQLPPVVHVAMIAIDEPSARMLEDKYGSDPNLGINYSSLFRDPAVLSDDPKTDAPNDGDLSKVEAMLTEKRASYRTFSTNVIIRGAKWSRSQAN